MTMMIETALGISIPEIHQQFTDTMLGITQLAKSIDDRLGLILRQQEEILRRLPPKAEVLTIEPGNSSSKTGTD